MTSVQNLLPTADQLRDRVRTALQAVGADVTLGAPGAHGLHASTPITGEVFCEVARSDESDIEKALDAAHAAAPAWGKTTVAERAVILNKTALGRYTFALGSNEEAVRLSGVNVDRWKVIIYTFAGGICGISGLLIASRLNSVQPALGQGYELDAIAAVVIGGTLLSGGVGYVAGTLFGVLTLGVIQTLIMFDGSLSSWWTRIVIGALLFVSFVGFALASPAPSAACPCPKA